MTTMLGDAPRRRNRMGRGQLFSLDLLIAAAVLAFSIGAVLQLQESAQRNFAGANSGAGNAAEIIADSLSGNGAIGSPAVAFCANYSNGTDGCAAFSCPGTVVAAKRITGCAGGGACALQVKACG